MMHVINKLEGVEGVCHQPEEERDCDWSLCHECDLWMMSGGDQAAVHLSMVSQFTSARGRGGIEAAPPRFVCVAALRPFQSQIRPPPPF